MPSSTNNKPIKAIAVFDTKKIKGIVYFTEDLNNNHVIIDIHIEGLKKNGLHGFHIHEYGDISEQCESMCSHFNPFGKKHGCPGSKERHVGDLGNIFSNGEEEPVMIDMVVNNLSLIGKYSVIGRALIVHEDADDLGKTNHPLSKTTGNSGARIACGVIGIASSN